MFLHLDLLLAALLIPAQLTLELLVLVGQDELVRQVILVEVVDEVPEALLAVAVRPQTVQIGLKAMQLQHLADLVKEAACTHELRRIVEMARASVGPTTLLDLPMHLLADGDLEGRCRDLVPAESAEDEDGVALARGTFRRIGELTARRGSLSTASGQVSIGTSSHLTISALAIDSGAPIAHLLTCFRNRLAKLGRQELALALEALLFELEAHLLTIDLIVVARLVSPRCLESTLAEVERVVDLAAKLRRRVK